MQIEGKIYLRPGEQPLLESDLYNEVAYLECEDYCGNGYPLHGFFSIYKPEVLLGELTKKLETLDQKFKVSQRTWKVTF